MSKPLRAIILTLFFVSGACGLVYEMIWVRELTLLLGISVYAVATVLSAYMAGLALGSFAFGRLVTRSPWTLRVYALLELGIGLVGLTWPFLLSSLRLTYVHLWELSGGATATLPWIRVLLAFFVLLPPTILMGGTFSVLSRAMTRTRKSLGMDLGLLYGMNTAGALWGCALSGFWLIEALGLQQLSQFTGLINVANAGIAWCLARRVPAAVLEPEMEEAVVAPPSLPPSTLGRPLLGKILPAVLLRRIVIAAFALNGLLAMASEVVWSRCLTFFLHNSTYAFTAMLTVYLFGMAAGTFAMRRTADRCSAPIAWFGIVEVGIGLSTVAALLMFTHLDLALELFVRQVSPAELQQAASGRLVLPSFSMAAVGLFVQAFLILLLPTFFMGAAFPLVARIAVVSLSQVGESVGSLYAANTIGGIAGSLLGGFFFLPTLGIRNAFLVFILGNVALGVLLMVLSPMRFLGTSWVMGSPKFRLGCLTASIVFAAALPFTLIPPDIIRSTFERHLGKVIYYADHATDTVMVSERKGPETRLLTFADGRGTSGVASKTQDRFHGHLPMMLHPGPKEILSICFGVGNTLAAIVMYPVQHIDCVELSEGVIGAAEKFPTNNGVFRDPRVSVHFEDGRNFLMTCNKKYDLIRMDPPEIHTAGVVNLYTKEFYELCRDHLLEGGIVCQWLNVNMMPIHEQKLLLSAFQAVFPHANVWFAKSHMYLELMSSPGPLTIDVERILECMRNDTIRKDLQSIQIYREWDVLQNFFLDEEGLRRYIGEVPPVTDDRTVVDFTAPRSVDANYGLCNAFSGLKFVACLKGGPLATNRYYSEKWLQMLDVWQSPVPYLRPLADAEHWKVLCREVELRQASWRENLRARMQALATRKELLPNF